MTQVPIWIWNEIAAEQAALLPDVPRQTFALESADALATLVDRWAEEMKPELRLPGICSAVVEIYPLMLAREAIQAYLAARPERAGLRQVLVEILTPKDAAELMQLEHRLTPKETLELETVLKSPLPLIYWRMALKEQTRNVPSSSAA